MLQKKKDRKYFFVTKNCFIFEYQNKRTMETTLLQDYLHHLELTYHSLTDTKQKCECHKEWLKVKDKLDNLKNN